MHIQAIDTSGSEERARFRYLIWFTTLVAGPIAALTMYPLTVWLDGYLYLGSARSFFGADFTERYQWVREPGYPAFLRTLNYLTSNHLVAVQSTQAIFLIFPIYGICRLILKPTNSRGIQDRHRAQRVTFCALSVAIVTPQYFGYSSMILKQSLVVSACSAAACAVYLSFRKSHILAILSVAIGSYFATGLSISAGYFWTGAAVVCGCNLARCLRFRSVLNFTLPTTLLISTTVILACLLLSVGSTQLSQSNWDWLTRDHRPATVERSGRTVSIGAALGKYINLDPELAGQIVQKMGSLTMITAGDNSGKKENNSFTTIQLKIAGECGHYDNGWTSPDTREYIAYSSYFHSVCATEIGTAIARSFHPVGHITYRLAVLAIPAAIIVSLRRRDLITTGILFLPVWFIAIYSFSGVYTNDRYGLPILPFGIAACCYLFLSLFHPPER